MKLPRFEAGEGHKKAAGKSGRPLGQELLAFFEFQFRELLEDERVRLVGQFGDDRLGAGRLESSSRLAELKADGRGEFASRWPFPGRRVSVDVRMRQFASRIFG